MVGCLFYDCVPPSLPWLGHLLFFLIANIKAPSFNFSIPVLLVFSFLSYSDICRTFRLFHFTDIDHERIFPENSLAATVGFFPSISILCVLP